MDRSGVTPSDPVLVGRLIGTQIFKRFNHYGMKIIVQFSLVSGKFTDILGFAFTHLHIHD